ncbi:MAG: SOS response-associated peptidase [Candidatus Tectomicrobia bacterium]|uniref:Abasic site processing protein n=1 Tax=Tectimicrobiota bacterium TaxID=2528274 RepID=A0A932MN99_UNCTE|nr:SOS response-associated peptidase [Candidatus Tectomicrobia bacterium]
MCGRYVLSQPLPWLKDLLGKDPGPGLRPRYNIAPGQDVPVIRLPSTEGEGAIAFLRWGLIPRWAKSPAAGGGLFNARADSTEKPAFREAFRARRCLVPADGFYEWAVRGSVRQPYFVHLEGNKPFCFAGLWERWEGPGGAVIESCAILTTEANRFLKNIHPRMPAILPRLAYASWLAPGERKPALLKALLAPYPGDEMVARTVGNRVNHPANDDPGCLEVAPPATGELPFEG